MPENTFQDAYPYQNCSHCDGTGGFSRMPPDLPGNCATNMYKYDDCAGCSDLLEIDARIADTRRVLDQLLKEREAKAADINKYHDPLARTLPIELVTSILGQSLPLIPFPCYNGYFTKEYLRALSSLTRVCKHWRNVVFETPSAWSYIGAVVNGKNHIKLVSTIERFLKMSKKHSLHIYLSYPISSRHRLDDVVLQSLSNIFELLGEEADRWQVVELDLPSAAMGRVSPCVKNSMPRLDNLHYSLNDGPVGSDDSDCCLRLQAAPQLLILNKRWGCVDVDLGRLTRVQFDWSSITVKECLFVLQSAPHLEDCELRVRRDEDHVDVQDALSTKLHFVHHRLHTLRCVSPPKQFWDTFSFPSLIINLDTDAYTDGTQAALKRFLDRSGGKIKNLDITAHSKWVDLLDSTPQVMVLQVAIVPADPCSFSMMDQAIRPDFPLSNLLQDLHCLELKIDNMNLEGITYSLNWQTFIRVLHTLRSKRKIFRRLTLKYTASHNGIYELSRAGCLPTKDEFGQLLCASEGFDFTMEDGQSVDIITGLRAQYDM